MAVEVEVEEEFQEDDEVNDVQPVPAIREEVLEARLNELKALD